MQQGKYIQNPSLVWDAGYRLCNGNTDYILNYLSILMVFGELRTGKPLYLSPEIPAA